ncbi:hypothetical protein LPTSP4_03390 [Leptospira ryugenii]|uniref:Glucose-methanol-choline oxidoreductase C-terminal domain-containing protein n=1 Tax=Leptospira ryugenii TaxID=1917863 RepID=A0A2P2DW23_9LEPT|nr:GMC oxidoreductase [Leptospira ryugenii]GBF48839.1 hypothetical protein LPTSP4_03390 [Leptospira ryugenii]
MNQNEVYDAIIVGSGPAGMASAYQLRGLNVLVLDVGNRPKEIPDFSENLYDLKEKRNLFKELIGESFESLHNIDKHYLSPKLKAPGMSFITEGQDQLSPVSTKEFEGVQSFSFGGLANAWGAGMLRFNEYDLQGFPISYADLKPYYDQLSDIMGISGENDDLSKFFGEDEKFLKPHTLGRLGEDLLSKYNKNKSLFHKNGFYFGKNRLAVLTEKKGNREPLHYDNLEFFKSNIPAIYNPTYTLNELIEGKLIQYRKGYLVESYTQAEGEVKVKAIHLESGNAEIFRTKYLVLAAGCLNSAKIVLRANNAYTESLPLYDNAISYVPFLIPKFIGKPIERSAYSAQLVFVHEDPKTKERINGSFYGLSGPLKSDLLFEFPLSLKANLYASKYLVPALAVFQLFYFDRDHSENCISLGQDFSIKISYKKQMNQSFKIEKKLISILRRFGYFSHSALCKFPAAGNSFHYAGCLPMKASPKEFQVDAQGKLWNSERVFIADSSNFSAFPAKNHSYTIMANAMRISDLLRKRIS